MPSTPPHVAILGAQSPLGAFLTARLSASCGELTLVVPSATSRASLPEGVETERADLVSIDDLSRAIDHVDRLVVAGTPGIADNRAPSNAGSHRRQLLFDTVGRAAREIGADRLLHVAALSTPGGAAELGELRAARKRLAAYGVPAGGWYARTARGPGFALDTVADRLADRRPPRLSFRWTRRRIRPVPAGAFADIVLEAAFTSQQPPDAPVRLLAPAETTIGRLSNRLATETGDGRAGGWDLPLGGSIVASWYLRADRSTVRSVARAVEASVPDSPVWQVRIVDENTDSHPADSAEHETGAVTELRRSSTGGDESIQRFALPKARSAGWLAEHYFEWLSSLIWPLVDVSRDDDDRVFMDLRGTGTSLLELQRVDSAESGRADYRIDGGVLARGAGEGRFEFRTPPDEDELLVALVDYRPALPDLLHRFTQALIHAAIMALFGLHLRRLPAADSEED